MLRVILNEKNVSLYQLEKTSQISHATLNDIYNERVNIDNCSILTMSKLASSLKMPIEELFNMLTYNNLSLFAFDEEFDLFKSNTLQQLKEMTQLSFINYVLESELIEKLYLKKDYLKALYLLSLIDYLCEKSNHPKEEKYKELREIKLKKVYVSKSLYLLLFTKKIKITEIFKECLKPFMVHNIMEAHIEDVA